MNLPFFSCLSWCALHSLNLNEKEEKWTERKRAWGKISVTATHFYPTQHADRFRMFVYFVFRVWPLNKIMNVIKILMLENTNPRSHQMKATIKNIIVTMMMIITIIIIIIFVIVCHAKHLHVYFHDEIVNSFLNQVFLNRQPTELMLNTIIISSDCLKSTVARFPLAYKKKLRCIGNLFEFFLFNLMAIFIGIH